MRLTLFFHLLGVILWAGGALNLSRMLAFHVQEELEIQSRISAFEVRLFFFVTLPGLALAAITGYFMLMNPMAGLIQQNWMQAKLALALLLIILTFMLGKRILLLRDTPEKGRKGPAMALHGVIGLCVAGVLYLVIVRPF